MTTENGLVAVGGSLSVETLVLAYSRGIFPWPIEGQPMLWFCPDPRGVLDFAEVHVPRSLKKFARQNPNFRWTKNKAFAQVIEECAKQPRPGQDGTWILPEIKQGYLELFKAGFVRSLECWDGDELIAGFYGVDVNGLFSAESMFFKRSNASKLCLWKMIENLQAEGRTWMDIQMVTPISECFGGKYISRADFLRRLGLSPDFNTKVSLKDFR
jgi:leucyl/phenylalanyl-tRNA--protein transferase